MRVLRIRELALIVLFLVMGVSYAQTVEEHKNKGIEYGAQGRFEEAYKEFKEALKIDHAYMPAKEGLRIIDDVLYKRIEREGAIHLFKGGIYGKKGMVDEAIGEYKKAISIVPNYVKAHNNLAEAYYSRGQYGLAIEHCDRTIELGSKVNPKILEVLKPYRK